MKNLLLLRHGPTPWNTRKVLQGLRDIPLSEAGRHQVLHWRLPNWARSARCFSSPLVRAVETARLLGLEPHRDPRLLELNWGDWEGCNLRQLRKDLGAGYHHNENKGLEFCPEGGESYRQAVNRLSLFLKTLHKRSEETFVLVLHKGLLQSALALSTGWDMKSTPDTLPQNNCAQHYQLDDAGRFILKAANLTLMPS